MSVVVTLILIGAFALLDLCVILLGIHLNGQFELIAKAMGLA